MGKLSGIIQQLGCRHTQGADLPSFAEAALACHASLYRYARSLCGDPGDAEELVQETYRRALAAGRKPATADEIRPWMFTILRNVWRNETRRVTRAREVLLEDLDGAMAGSSGSSEAAITKNLLISEVRTALDSLPVLWREIIVMRDMEELSYSQIAEILGCPVGTVMSRLSRARGALRRALVPQASEAPR